MRDLESLHPLDCSRFTLARFLPIPEHDLQFDKFTQSLHAIKVNSGLLCKEERALLDDFADDRQNFREDLPQRIGRCRFADRIVGRPRPGSIFAMVVNQLTRPIGKRPYFEPTSLYRKEGIPLSEFSFATRGRLGERLLPEKFLARAFISMFLPILVNGCFGKELHYNHSRNDKCQAHNRCPIERFAIKEETDDGDEDHAQTTPDRIGDPGGNGPQRQRKQAEGNDISQKAQQCGTEFGKSIGSFQQRGGHHL